MLHRACAKQQSEVAKLLINVGARSDARSSAGDTAMHCAAREGLEDIAMNILQSAASSDADLKALEASNLAGETPLHLAMSSNTAKCATAPPNHRTGQSQRRGAAAVTRRGRGGRA